MRCVSKHIPGVNPILNAPAKRIGGPKIHRRLPDPRVHQALPGLQKTSFPGLGVSSSQIQAEVKLDPGDLPLFIVGQAGMQPVWLRAQLQRDAVLGKFSGAHIFGDRAITVCVFNHAKYRPRPDLCAGVDCHAAHSRNRLAMRAANLSPLKRKVMASRAVRERSAARRLSRVRRRKASASAWASSDGTRSPFTPSSMSSGIPEIGVVTTGTPTAMASRSE